MSHVHLMRTTAQLTTAASVIFGLVDSYRIALCYFPFLFSNSNSKYFVQKKMDAVLKGDLTHFMRRTTKIGIQAVGILLLLLLLLAAAVYRRTPANRDIIS